MTVMVTPITAWYCPNCGKRDETRETGAHTRFHPCPKLRMIDAPMLRQGIKAKVELHEWEDYVGKEMVQTDPVLGRPIRSIVTTRDNGQDTIVLAPTATLRGTT